MPARGGKVPARGAAPTRGTPAKTRAGAQAAKPHVNAKSATPTPDTVHVVEPEVEKHKEDVEHEVEGYHQEESSGTLVDEPEHFDEAEHIAEHAAELTEEPAAHGSEVQEEAEDIAAHGAEPQLAAEETEHQIYEDEVHEEHHVVEASEAVEKVVETAPVDYQAEGEVHVEVEPATPVPTAETEESEHSHDETVDHDNSSETIFSEEPSVTSKTGGDLEDIVNLLEPKPRPMSVALIPDEVAEIPDEF